jgi:hypothetical protein
MGQKLPENENELYRRVDEVLHYIWDPIGVSGVPGARDEYYSYLPHVFSLLKRGADDEEIATYLGKITAERMEIGTNRSRDFEVAEILTTWRDNLLDPT